MGDELIINFISFKEPKFIYDEIIDKIYNIEPEGLREKESFVKGFFLGDGSSEIFNYNSKIKHNWHLNKKDFDLIQKLQRFCKEIWKGIDFKIYDVGKSIFVYRLSVCRNKHSFRYC